LKQIQLNIFIIRNSFFKW